MPLSTRHLWPHIIHGTVIGMNVTSYVNPKINRNDVGTVHGRGIFAKERIAKDEIVCIKAGHIVDGATLQRVAPMIADADLQIADDLYITPITSDEVEDSMVYINHSCTPNVGFRGDVVLVAMRDIEPGEEATVDYAQFDNNDTRFDCLCGTRQCRKAISGRDWQRPELQQRYEGYFSAYLEKKINRGE